MDAEKEKELQFARILEEIKNLAKEQNNSIAKEQVEEALADLALSQEQMDLVYDYLKQNRIGIGQPADPEDYLEQEDLDYLAMYLEELEAMTPTEEERERILQAALKGEAEARDRLVTLFLPQVAEIARLYGGQGVPMEDLIGEGNVALTLGSRLPELAEDAAELEGNLTRLVMDAMERCIAEQNGQQKAGVDVAERVNLVADAAKSMSEELLREVTLEELAAESQIPIEEIREAWMLSGYQISGIDEKER